MGFQTSVCRRIGRCDPAAELYYISSFSDRGTATAKASGIDSFVKKLMRFAGEKDDLLAVGQ